MNNKVASGESCKLLTLLNSLEKELEVTYLERRKRGNSHKSTSIEELQDAIQEIGQREKDLRASIGISKVLLENNEKLQLTAQTLEQDKENLEELLKDRSQELENIKNEIHLTEEKYQKVNSKLIKLELKFLKSPSETKEFQYSRSTSLRENDKINTEKHDSDINELTSKFQQEYDYILSNFY